MKIILSTESTADLSKELIDENKINIIPYPVMLGENQYYDGVDIDPLKIFDFVDKNGTLPKTSAINEFSFEEYFDSLLKEADGIIHISLSSGISSTCNNAKAVAQMEKFKNKVAIIDSKSLSSGIGLLVLYAAKLIKEGLTLKEIEEKVNQRVPAVQASFVINTVEYLYKGGRCSSLAKFAATILRLKPQIIVENGKMHPGKKFAGRSSQVVNKYCKETLEEFNNPDKSIVFITHSHANKEMVDVARKILIEHGFVNIYETIAGATISSHCGPKTLGILYFNDGGKVN